MADTYCLLFRLPYEAKFRRTYNWPDDRTAIDRAREELELFVGPWTKALAGTVLVHRILASGALERLGDWEFEPAVGFEWTAAELGCGGGGAHAADFGDNRDPLGETDND